MEDAIVKLRNIHKTFGENAVLKGVDLDIRKGEVVTLMGPSGTGKTTLLRCINLLERPEQGSIQIGGDFADCARLDRKSTRLNSSHP